MLTILIVDDEYQTLEGLKQFISWEKMGYSSVYTARNVIEALDIIEKQSVNVLLTDISMPGASGIELASKARALIPEISIVFISAYADKDNLMSAIHLQVEDFIEKPVDLEEVEQVMGKLADQLLLNNDTAVKDIRMIAAEGQKNTDAITAGIRNYIEINYMRPDLTLTDISKELFVSVPYMCSVFKKNTGITIKDYINDVRIRNALQIMKESHLKLYEVAQRVGYTNYSYFSRFFKSETNKNPKNCR